MTARRAIRRALDRLSVGVQARAARRELAGRRPKPYGRVGRRVRRLSKTLVPQAAWEEVAVDEDLLAERRAAMGTVDLPLVLAGQVGRSGGTLMLRLFDSHPSCLVIPHELGQLLPSRPLPRDPNEAFVKLTPRMLWLWHRDGIRIGKSGRSGERQHTQPFGLDPNVLRRLFVDAVREDPPQTERDLLNRYFSAYFAAWTDGPSVDGRKWIIGFEPSAIEKSFRMTGFDANYPDGRVLVTIRDPWSWMVSAQAWGHRFKQREVAMNKWLRSTRAALERKAVRPGETLLVSFEDLLVRSEQTMRAVSDFLEIPFDDTLVTPTLNAQPADTNSSFRGVSGLSSAPADRRAKLDPQLDSWITGHAAATWDEARSVLS